VYYKVKGWQIWLQYSGVGTMGTGGGTLYPPSSGLVPLYPSSLRCGLCQDFKQTTLTTRLYKVRTNLYPHLRKRSDAPASVADKLNFAYVRLFTSDMLKFWTFTLHCHPRDALPAQYYACVCLSVSVTCLCSVETSGRIKLVFFAWRLLRPIQHRVVRKCFCPKMWS